MKIEKWDYFDSNQINDFFSDSVVSSGVVVGGILLSGHQLFRVKELPVSSGPDFIDDGRFEVHEDGTRYVLAGSGFYEEL